ncbi:Probable ATP-dependent RNA helicase spindle-E [Gryllus bimaculatus]|nr:Probable ATP-dependent RNA helicase spindle-E [Gryllus bimaculatus]
MDLLDDFFNLNKKFERVVVPGSQTGGRIMVDPDSVPDDYRRHKVVSKGTDYVKEFREEDERLWRELPEIKIDEPGISPKTYEIAFKLISQFDNLERSSEVFVKGAVLVFLPGIQEIEELFNLLATKSSQNKWWVRPLHSTITTDEQESVFSRPPSGYRKIILSTNIAESSLTVPDIVYVIDFCLTKHLICDPATNFSSLQVAWASKTSCIQRAGRAGRVQEGRVYRLVPATFYNECLADDQIPEILRCPLDRAGALLPTVNGLYKRDDGDLTFLGTVMAKLPVDIHVAKLIMLGHVFNVLEECIIIGAALSLKSMFSSPFQERMAAYDSKLMWADSSCSDSIAFLNAFNVWRSSKERGMFGPNGQKEESWARRYYLQLRALRETATLVRELRERLERMGITETKGYGRVSWSREESPLILKIVMAGAFYPHYFVRGSNGGQVDEKEAVRQLVGRDPFSTVFLQSLPMDQPGELYAKTIKRALGECGRNMKVSFDGTSKVYIQFGRPATATAKTKTDFKFIPDIPGKVCMPVYKAVKLRQLKIPIVLHLMPARNAMERARELNLQPAQDSPWRWERKKEDSSVMKPSLPSVNTHIISLSISYIIDPGHFWAQSLEPDAIETLSEISRKLNTVDELLPVRAPKIGKIYAAPFTEHGSTYYYRARVNSIRPPKVQVLFIDYGNSSEVDIIDLREIRDATDPSTSAPPQAFECVLSELRPSLINNPRGGWSDTAKQDFSSKVGNYLFYGKIYSVVHGVVSLELIRQLPLNVKNKKGEEIKSINEYLIDKGYAEPAEESYLSRVILKGPFSPLEMKVYNITQVGLSRVVQIEWNSVNSVLLDTDPQDPHERLLVAACVGENPDHDRLTVRNTTLMPNIHGLSSLIYLVFAPTIELRRSPDGTTYTGALCGLGADPQTGVSYFPDHDMEVTFDTVITLQDIKNINRLRYWMTISFYTDADQEYPSCATSDMIQCQGKVKEFLFKLLNVPRPSQEVQLFHRPFKWNQVRKDLLLNPLAGGAVHENARAVFRLHWAVYLESKVDTSLVENVKFLHEVAEGKVTYSGDIDCKLCNIAFANARLLRIHLLSSHHVEKEKELVSR